MLPGLLKNYKELLNQMSMLLNLMYFKKRNKFIPPAKKKPPTKPKSHLKNKLSMMMTGHLL
jgi:hypothetical protein